MPNNPVNGNAPANANGGSGTSGSGAAAQASVGRLLIVDDDPAQTRALCDILAAEGYDTTGFTSAKKALAALDHAKFDILLTDLAMPYMDGIGLIEAAQQVDPDLVAVVLTGFGTIDAAVQSMQTGAIDFVCKPIKLVAVRPVLERALAIRRLKVENRALARKLTDHVRELELANRELEAFSYSVSHDLRAPLRAIDGYCRAFLEANEGLLTDDGKELLEKALEGTTRMDALIENLLALARVAWTPLRIETVQIEPLVREILADLLTAEMPTKQRPEILIGSLPACQGDPALLRQAFTNLLSNALKFTGKLDKPCIEVSAEKSCDDAEVAYVVKDNGAGFDMKHLDTLFRPFRRLHAAAEFEGTGIGLSIVKRITERLGGRVWAEGRPGHGAQFHLAMRKAS